MEKTIYKKDSSGKVRYLTVKTLNSMLYQISGVLGTDNPIIHEKQCKPKNIGKANETTAQEQAISEGESKIAEKLRQGYFETIEEAQYQGGSDFMSPMLAHDFKKYEDKIEWPCFVQPKLDGIRCFDTPEGKVSRTNKPIFTMDHINVRATLVDFDGSDVGIVLEDPIVDGELYAHGLSFQENVRLIKKYRPGKSEQIKYHIYDIVSDAPFSERIKAAKEIAEASENCEFVPTFEVRDMEQVKAYHQIFLGDGYEGTIIRWGDKGYDINKRSKYLLKYKDFIDEAYLVVDVVPNIANPNHGTIVCGFEDSDITFRCGMKFSHAEREEMLINKHKYIGEVAEIRFFEFSEDGIPRFPVCVGFRIDK